MPSLGIIDPDAYFPDFVVAVHVVLWLLGVFHWMTPKEQPFEGGTYFYKSFHGPANLVGT